MFRHARIWIGYCGAAALAALASVSAAGTGLAEDGSLPIIESLAIWRNEAGDSLRLAGLAGPLPEHQALGTVGRRALEALLAGDGIRLEPPVPRRDRLGRALIEAYRLSDDLWLQAWLLRQGHARADPFSAAPRQLPALYALEAEARAAGKGLWQHPAYRLRSSDPAALLDWAGSLQIFEGVVAAVGTNRSGFYMNFGTDWKTDTTARIARHRIKRFRDSGIALEALAGKRVRLRGWIQTWNGPFVELHTAGQLEIIPPETVPPETVPMDIIPGG
ncbi:MAG: thermonuclease family protein [Rhodospirillales bacterium]|nr:thermonuclease family protein [Rhodospirillales bacterium]